MLRSRITFVVLTLALLACSSNDAPPPSVGAITLPPAPPPSNPAAGCMDSAATHPPGSTCVLSVRGQILDSDDMPVSAPLAVCGGGVLCIGSAVDEGSFSVNVNRFVDLSTFVLHVYGHPRHGDMIAPLPKATTSVVTLVALPRVPRFEFKGPALPIQTALLTVIRSGPVELTLAPGTQTAVAPAHEKTRELLAGPVFDPTKWDPKAVALYAVGPFGATFSIPAAVAITLPATASVPDGTSLDLVVLEDDLRNGLGGTLVSVGSATVTGGVARSVAGTGIQHLTWIGVRLGKGS